MFPVGAVIAPPVAPAPLLPERLSSLRRLNAVPIPPAAPPITAPRAMCSHRPYGS